MSCRQAATPKAKGKRQKAKITRGEAALPANTRSAPLPFAFCLLPFAFTSVFDICHLTRIEAAEQLARPLAVELGVDRFDEHEEAVARGEREVRRVEDRVVRLG